MPFRTIGLSNYSNFLESRELIIKNKDNSIIPEKISILFLMITDQSLPYQAH